MNLIRVVTIVVLSGGLCAGLALSDEAASFKGSEREDEWYAKHLRAMGEPYLWAREGDPATTSYRLLWLRSFHRPVAIRVELAPHVPPSVFVRVLDGQGGYEPGRLEVSEQRVLTGREVRELRRRLESTGFWELPLHRPGRMIDGREEIIVCTDGAAWILEGVEKGRYQFVNWSCLDEGEPPWVLGEHFLGLSGIEFEEIY